MKAITTIFYTKYSCDWFY